MTLSGDQIDSYLDRIGFTADPKADLATLAGLQRAHMTAVPFENLDVFHRRGVHTSADWSVPKIVEKGRGGWCFELNGAFGELLSGLGFSVTRLAGGVMLGGGNPPDDPDHLTLRVDLDAPYLVDVGFGDSAIRPLRLDDAGPQDGGDRTYRFRRDDKFTYLEAQGEDEDGGWAPSFRFDATPRELADFDSRSNYLQNEPGLHWTEAPFATRLIGHGSDRVWLLKDRIKLRRDGHIETTGVPEYEWAGTLQTWFGLDP